MLRNSQYGQRGQHAARVLGVAVGPSCAWQELAPAVVPRFAA